MIKIYRSSSEYLRKYLHDKHTGVQNSIYLSLSKVSDGRSVGFPCFWAGSKIVFALFKERMDAEKFNRIIGDHKIAASVFSSEWEEKLSKKELEEKHELSSRILSHLTHNFFVQEPFYKRISSMFAALMKEQTVQLVIPDLERVDAPTLTVIFDVFKFNENGQSSLILGLEEGFDIVTESTDLRRSAEEDGDYFDENGLLWHYSSFGIKNMIFSFLAMGGEIEYLEKTPVGQRSAYEEDHTHLLTDEPEHKLLKVCQSTETLGQKEASLAYNTILRSFASFDFSATLSLGLLILKRDFPFSDSQLADINAILALITHNRQFSSTLGNDETNSFIEKHLKRAFELEKDPTKIAFLMYRMTVLKARRQKNLAEGMEWANKTIEQAENENIREDLRHYTKAWALNIRAYIYMITKRMNKAYEDMVVANKSAQILKNYNASSRDYAFTISVMADNMGALTELMGQPFEVKPWLAASFKSSGWHLTNKRFGARIWTESHLKMLRVDLAIDDTLTGLEAARIEANPFYEDLYLAHLGEFYHRLDKNEESISFFEEALSLHQKYFSSNRYTNICILAAKYAFHAGLVQKGSDLLERAEAKPSLLNDYRLAEIKLLRGQLAALTNDEKAACLAAQESLEDALEKGEMFNLLYTIIICAQISAMIGNEDDERQLYEKGLDIMDIDGTEMNSTTTGIAANIILNYLRYEDNQDKIFSFMTKLLEMLPIALIRNAESWNHLHLFFKLYKNYGFQLNRDQEQSFFLILTAGLQREDCKGLTKEITNSFSKEQLDRFHALKKSTDYSMNKSNAA